MQELEDRRMFAIDGILSGAGTLTGTFGPFMTSIMLGGPGAAQLLSGQTGFNNPFANVANVNGENPFTLPGALALLGFTPPAGTGIAPTSRALDSFVNGRTTLVQSFPVTSTLASLGFTPMFSDVNPAYRVLSQFGMLPNFTYDQLFGALWGGQSILPFSAQSNAARSFTAAPQQRSSAAVAAGTAAAAATSSGNSGVAAQFDMRSFDSLLNAVGKYEQAWAQAGTGDFNGDGTIDLVYRNYATGENALALMDGGAHVQQVVSLPQVTNTNWVISTTGDMNNDGQPDLLWRNYKSGDNVVWVMNGTQPGGTRPLESVKNLSWVLEGTGDFNGDSRTDLVWRNYRTGENRLWTLGPRSTVRGSQLMRSITDPNWILAGTGDLNADGKPDLVWRDSQTGQDMAWQMNGAAIEHRLNLPRNSRRGQAIAGIADLNHDGRDDLIFRDVDRATTRAWLMNGTSVSGSQTLPSPLSALTRAAGTFSDTPVLDQLRDYLNQSQEAMWTVAGTGDFTGDGLTDVLFRNYSTGANRLWEMNGTQVARTVDLPSIDDVTEVISATTEVDGDGYPDILYRNYTSGANQLMLSNGGDVKPVDLPAVTNANWCCAGSGYFNSDATPDVLWFNPRSGESVIWFLRGDGAVIGTQQLPRQSDSSTFVGGIGDFNGDGRSDILWRNDRDGSNFVWLNGRNGIGLMRLASRPDSDWYIAGTGDLDRDGNLDLLWQSYSQGQREIWLLNGDGQVTQSLPLEPLSASEQFTTWA